MENNLRIIKDDPYVSEALYEFDKTYEAGGDSVTSDEWRALAKKYDNRLQDIVTDLGWHDLLLIHWDGDIVYTVAKDADLGMIIPDSKLAKSPLGKGYAQIQSVPGKEAIIARESTGDSEGSVPGFFFADCGIFINLFFFLIYL